MSGLEHSIGFTVAGGSRSRGRPRPNKTRRPPRDDLAMVLSVKRWLGWLAKGLIGALLIYGLYVAGQWSLHYVRHSPAFAIETLELRGPQRLTRHEVLRAAGIKLGDNAFAHNPVALEKRLTRHRWIAHATVHRTLPDRYTIEIAEHQPTAVLALSRLYLVSKEGAVFKQLGLGDPTDLPVITGVDPARFNSDRAYRASSVMRALAFLEDYQKAGLSQREPLAEVHLLEGDEIAAYIGRDVTYVRLGKKPYRAKLTQLKEILARLDAQYLRAAYVYLDNVRRPDRAVVKVR
ncbi:MAG: FtsQ-type POTRA domain-containing protein [Myxococcales bacterium]|nr:FtsQ-type POTRA domain-containing protein [Myxococcales bacterium]